MLAVKFPDEETTAQNTPVKAVVKTPKVSRTEKDVVTSFATGTAALKATTEPPTKDTLSEELTIDDRSVVSIKTPIVITENCKGSFKAVETILKSALKTLVGSIEKTLS